jgi:hypothetical protein
MQASWGIELAEDSAVLTVPWTDDAGRVAYIDLRAQPEAIQQIPEARENPPLAVALSRLNAADSRWATGKCDRWGLDEDDLQTAIYELDLESGEGSTWNGIGSYIDFYSLELAQFLSLQHHRELLQRLTSAAEGLAGHPTAMLELTLRRCVAEGQDGYAVTAFVYAVGGDAAQAEVSWAAALAAMADILLACRVAAIE